MVRHYVAEISTQVDNISTSQIKLALNITMKDRKMIE